MFSFMRESLFHWSYGSAGDVMARLEQHGQDHQVCMARVLDEQLVKNKQARTFSFDMCVNGVVLAFVVPKRDSQVEVNSFHFKC